MEEGWIFPWYCQQGLTDIDGQSFQNILTYLHNKTDQNKINSSGQGLNAVLWQLYLAVDFLIIFPM